MEKFIKVQMFGSDPEFLIKNQKSNKYISSIGIIPGTKEEPHKIWIPLILLFTGARTNEIAQLYVEHIKEKEGIHLFKIKDEQEDQSTKNKSSNREVPIHKTLIDLGFLKYVEYQKKLKKV